MLIELPSFKNSIFRTYLTYLMSLLLYSVLIVFLFVKWVVPVYTYKGYTIDFNWTNISMSIMYIAIISYFVAIQVDNIKAFFISMLIVTVIIPMLCLYSFTEEFVFYDMYILMIMFCVFIISLTCFIFIDLSGLSYRITFNRLLLPFMAFVTFFTLVRYVMLNGFGIFNLDITKVYDYRFLLRETMTGIFAYVDAWTIKIINPFCIIYSLYKKNKYSVAFFVMFQILLFGFSSHKSVLFSVLVLIIFYKSLSLISKEKTTIIWIFICGCLFPLFLYFRNITGIWCGLFRRVFFTPATLNFNYYDYFSLNNFSWFRTSFLRHFSSSEYGSIARLIGFEYVGNVETHANTGFLGAGYAQGGFLVMIVYSVIIGMLINVIAAFCKKLPPGLAVGITILPMSSLFTSGDLPSSLVTGGLLIALLLLNILSKDPTIGS